MCSSNYYKGICFPAVYIHLWLSTDHINNKNYLFGRFKNIARSCCRPPSEVEFFTYSSGIIEPLSRWIVIVTNYFPTLTLQTKVTLSQILLLTFAYFPAYYMTSENITGDTCLRYIILARLRLCNVSFFFFIIVYVLIYIVYNIKSLSSAL